MTELKKSPEFATRELLSVLIPAHNEEQTIESTVHNLVAALDSNKFEYEILVVNDSSQDDTFKKLVELADVFPQLRHIDNPGPNGYGRAVRHGLKHFRGSSVVIVMADGADSPADVVKYYQTLGEDYDCVFGSRFIPGAKVENYPRFKRILNRLGNRLIALLLRQRYNDFTNGFKCYRREVIEKIQPLKSDAFNLTIEMSMKTVLNGARFAVVPNDWVDRASGESKFKLFSQTGLYLRTVFHCLREHRYSKRASR